MDLIRLDLRAIIYREDAWWIAHCLELDLPAEGDSPKQALESLIDLISVQVDAAMEEGDLESIYRPAPSELWRLFSIATRDRPLRRKPPKPISRFEARELELA